jgi:hypothetical protein
MKPDDQPATKRDISELREALIEQMRDMQTEVLRQFERDRSEGPRG